MTMAGIATAGKAAATHGAASQIIPSGQGQQEQQILLLLILAGVIIFIQHDASGKSQNGSQYAALGVVGFLLLVLAQFWGDMALAFTVLFVVAVVLNSPKGIPLISTAATGGTDTGGNDPSTTVKPSAAGTPNPVSGFNSLGNPNVSNTTDTPQ